MSPSKKANKQDSKIKTRSAQQAKKTAMRSSRVPGKRTETKSAPKSSRIISKPIPASTPVAITTTVSPSAEVTKSTQKTSLSTNILRVISLLAVIAITVYIFSISSKVEQFKNYGYAGAFIVALLANATVLLPAPGVAIIYAMGAVFNPLAIGLAAGTGGALGELSGYLAGFSGQGIIERNDVYERVKPLIEKYEGWAILILAAIPNPFFDIAGIAAGITKMPLRTFLFSVWVGQLIKMTAFAFAGRYSINFIAQFVK